MAHFRIVVTGCLLLVTGCDAGVTSPTGSYPAVSAQMTSRADGSPLLAALGEVRDGAYRDSLLDLGDGHYLAGFDRGGIYAVHIEKEEE